MPWVLPVHRSHQHSVHDFSGLLSGEYSKTNRVQASMLGFTPIGFQLDVFDREASMLGFTPVRFQLHGRTHPRQNQCVGRHVYMLGILLQCHASCSSNYCNPYTTRCIYSWNSRPSLPGSYRRTIESHFSASQLWLEVNRWLCLSSGECTGKAINSSSSWKATPSHLCSFPLWTWWTSRLYVDLLCHHGQASLANYWRRSKDLCPKLFRLPPVGQWRQVSTSTRTPASCGESWRKSSLRLTRHRWIKHSRREHSHIQRWTLWLRAVPAFQIGNAKSNANTSLEYFSTFTAVLD